MSFALAFDVTHDFETSLRNTGVPWQRGPYVAHLDVVAYLLRSASDRSVQLGNLVNYPTLCYSYCTAYTNLSQYFLSHPLRRTRFSQGAPPPIAAGGHQYLTSIRAITIRRSSNLDAGIVDPGVVEMLQPNGCAPISTLLATLYSFTIRHNNGPH
jgi:hypothetical protein